MKGAFPHKTAIRAISLDLTTVLDVAKFSELNFYIVVANALFTRL